MKAKDLAIKLLQNPDFDVRFSFTEKDDSEWGINVRTFEKVSIGDIGHSDKIICLAGTERE